MHASGSHMSYAELRLELSCECEDIFKKITHTGAVARA